MMTSVILMVVFMFAFLILSLVSTILIAVWIYRDAKKRNMDATLWTLLVIFIPSYIGIIVYLVSRNKEKIYVCPRCGASVKTEYTICPECSLQLKRQCQQCGLPCEETWHNCPRCSSQLEPIAYPMSKPQEHKDHLVRNIVLLIVANIVAAIGIYASMFAFMFQNPEFLVEINDTPFVEAYDEYEFFSGELEL